MTPPLCGGNILQYAKVTTLGGDVIEGVLHSNTDEVVKIWPMGDPYVLNIEKFEIKSCEILEAEQDPPLKIAKSCEAKTGGIGLHVRKQVQFHKGEDETPCTLAVCVNDEDSNIFESIFTINKQLSFNIL